MLAAFMTGDRFAILALCGAPSARNVFWSGSQATRGALPTSSRRGKFHVALGSADIDL